MSQKTNEVQVRLVGEFDRVQACCGQLNDDKIYKVSLKDGRRIVILEPDYKHLLEQAPGYKFQGTYFKYPDDGPNDAKFVLGIVPWDGMTPDGTIVGGSLDRSKDSFNHSVDEFAHNRTAPVVCEGSIVEFASPMSKAEIESSTEGLRFDTGKNRLDQLDPRFVWMLGEIMTDNPGIRIDLIPRCAIEELAKVYTEGAKKYTDNNWQKGMKWTKVIGPLMRHLTKWLRGEKLDSELKVHHLGQVMWNCAALIYYENNHPHLDDRNRKHMDLGNGQEI